MRILVVIYEFPPVGGGGGMAARSICQALQARGHEVHVVTAHYKGLPQVEYLDGIQVIRVRSLRKLQYQAKPLTMLGFIIAGGWAAWRHLRAWRPEVMHVHFAVPSGPVAWALSRLSGVPYVLTAHLGDVPGGVPEKTGGWFRWVSPLTPPIWHDAAEVAAVSDYTRQLALKHYPRQIHIIPNGIDLEKIPHRERAARGDEAARHAPEIVFAGRLTGQKNPLQLVRSLVELQHLPWQCRIIGDGSLRADMQREIEQAGLQDRFTFPGWVTPEEVMAYFSKADILFMPSLSEGLPVVGVQALAMGLAIVASRIGGFTDLVVDGDNGYLVDPARPEGYSAALEKLLSAPQRLLEFQQASLAKSADFDIRNVAERYEQLFALAVSNTYGLPK